MFATRSIDPQDSEQDGDAARPVGGVADRRRIVWAVIGLGLLLVIGLRVAGVVGPRPCTSCHDRADFRAGTQASPHSSVGCRDCHMSSGWAGEATFTLQRPLHAYFRQARASDRELATVPNERCGACHEKVLEGVVVANGLRINHRSCAATTSCLNCHSAIAHGTATRWVRSYDMDVCLECHVALKKVACDLCHEGREVATRVKFATFAVTHGPKWKSTHGMGDAATCNVCHVVGDCADCHGAGVPHEADFVKVHEARASGSNARCATCHEDTFCNGCHGTEMPHPAGFTPRHATAAKGQPDLCTRCHEKSDCTECHTKHIHPGGAIDTAVSGGGGRR